MGKCSSIIIILIIGTLGLCQNLVPNPGFENIVLCPDTFGQITLAAPWKPASQTRLGINLFHTCSSNPLLIPPNVFNYYVYQYPRSGQSMAYFYAVTNIGDRPVSDYLGTVLKKSLTKDVNYYIKFYVNPQMNFAIKGAHNAFFDAVGLAFTEKEYFEVIPNNEAMKLKPAIENRGKVISDTAGWTKVSGCYKAIGNEQYAIIGNFRKFEELIVYRPSGQIVWPEGIGYFLDDVLITAFDPLPDTMMLCDGEEIKINAGFYEATYKWNTGVEDSIITISEPGKYIVDAYLDGCVFSDTMVVIEEVDWNSLEEDTTLCYGEALLIKAPTWGKYKWSTGSENSSIEVKEKGIYSLKIENDCGLYEYQIEVDTINCKCNVLVPNIFTPDGDFINDQISVKFDCDFGYRIVDFWIFDRWGEEIYYETGDNTILWNGTFKNEKVTPGVYVWVLRLELSRNNKVENKVFSGDITILR